MPAKKKEITLPVPKDEKEFLRHVNDCAVLQLELEQQEAALNELLAKTGEDLRASIEAKATAITASLGMLQAYAHLHRDTLFSKYRKSSETTQATFGYADNPAAIKLLGKEFTEDTAVESLLKLGKVQFVRTVREVDREGIKGALHAAAEMESAEDRPSDWKPAITLVDLRMCGLKLQQTERFYVKPKRAAESEASTGKVITP